MKLTYKAPKSFTYESLIDKASTKFGDALYDINLIEAPEYVIDVLKPYASAFNASVELVVVDSTNITLYSPD